MIKIVPIWYAFEYDICAESAGVVKATIAESAVVVKATIAESVGMVKATIAQ